MQLQQFYSKIKRKQTENGWKIFTTEILSKTHPEENCNALQIIFNPTNEQNSSKVGDIDLRAGKIKIAQRKNTIPTSRQMFFDSDLSLLPSDIDGSRHLHLVLYEERHDNVVLACSRIRSVKPKVLRYVVIFMQLICITKYILM